jgi:hypothetical protein
LTLNKRFPTICSLSADTKPSTLLVPSRQIKWVNIDQSSWQTVDTLPKATVCVCCLKDPSNRQNSALGAKFLVGGFNHLEKYESQWEGLSHRLWTITNV